MLAILGGAGFIAAINVAVALSGPTITGFVAPLYAVLATLFAVPILGEPVRAVTVAAFIVALGGTVLLAGTAPLGAPLAGIAHGLRGAAMFGLYLVLARRWSGPYRLDGTLVTIANLLARGPGLLAVAVGGRDETAHPGQPRPGGDPRAHLDRHRCEQHRQPPGDGQRAPRAGRTNVGRPAADADLVGD